MWHNCGATKSLRLSRIESFPLCDDYMACFGYGLIPFNNIYIIPIYIHTNTIFAGNEHLFASDFDVQQGDRVFKT